MLKNEDIKKTVRKSINTSRLKLFEKAAVNKIIGIRVFDVGQGDCIGLIDQKNKVFCYVDYGGLNDHPDKNNQSYTKHRLPVEDNGKYVSIILTHWDKDHFWSANFKNPDAQNCEWLVPRQKASPQAVLFASKLSNAKCWPESIGKTTVSFAVGNDYEIEIRKCAQYDKSMKNENRNHTGLAVSLQKRISANKPAMRMILPGDCPFDKIPGIKGVQLKALVAYHHGSHAHWKKGTSYIINKNKYSPYNMVYSFGKNTYGHPDYSKYLPDWNNSSDSTVAVRARFEESTDLNW